MTSAPSGATHEAKHLAFLVEDYRPQYWFWEVTELARKLLLTGVAALWVPGTLMQVIASMFVALTNALLIARCRPYRGHADARSVKDGRTKQAEQRNGTVTNMFALQAVVMTLLSLFGALLVKFHSGFQATGAVDEGYDHGTLQGFLIATALLTGVLGLAIVLHEVGRSGVAKLAVAGLGRFGPAAECAARAICAMCKRVARVVRRARRARRQHPGRPGDGDTTATVDAQAGTGEGVNGNGASSTVAFHRVRGGVTRQVANPLQATT